jgi:hypothetical protein
VARLQAEGTPDVDKRKTAEVLDLVLAIAREYRKDRRELSVSLLGQELQKRMNPLDFQRHARGRSQPLAQALAAHGSIKLVSRGFIDWIYLPDEPDELIAAEVPQVAPEPPRYSYAGLVYADLPEDVRERLIVAIHDDRHRPGTDYLTFKRILTTAMTVLNRDEYSVKNLINNMIDISVLVAEPLRSARAPDGTFYTFKTFGLDLKHADVRRALKLAV